MLNHCAITLKKEHKPIKRSHPTQLNIGPGDALACISLINIKINHIPFDFNLLKVFFIGIVVYLNSALIPNIENPFYSILVNGIFITLVFWTLIFVFKISDDINDFAKKQIKKIRRLENF